MRIAKWGDSLAVRHPAAVVEALRLKEGDDIEIHAAGEREFAVTRKPRGFPESAARLSRSGAAILQVRPR
jgi:antitoxin component of MazEF toxin-antitoxin module